MGHPKAAIYLANLRKRKRAALQALKSGPCTDCGKTLDPACMDFDHRGDKVMDVAALVKYASMTRVKEEIAKCDLVCVLCHRTRTYDRRQTPNSDSYAAQSYRKKREMVWAFKARPCHDCGIQYEPWQMDVDHLDPTTKKQNRIGTLSLSFKQLAIDLPKCVVRCAACHRLKTFQNKEHRQ